MQGGAAASASLLRGCTAGGGLRNKRAATADAPSWRNYRRPCGESARRPGMTYSAALQPGLDIKRSVAAWTKALHGATACVTYGAA